LLMEPFAQGMEKRSSMLMDAQKSHVVKGGVH